MSVRLLRSASSSSRSTLRRCSSSSGSCVGPDIAYQYAPWPTRTLGPDGVLQEMAQGALGEVLRGEGELADQGAVQQVAGNVDVQLVADQVGQCFAVCRVPVLGQV